MFQLLSTTMIITWLFIAGAWDWFGYYIRYIFPIVLIIVVYLSWRKIKKLPFRTHLSKKEKLNVGINGILAFIFGLYTIVSLSGFTTEDEPIELQFPLQDGAYYIGQGGNHEQINHHQQVEAQQYALDIMKLNAFQTRAKGIYPKDLEKYEIYGEPLYSPCSGEVMETRGHLEDLTPPERDQERLEGNYVAVACDGDEEIKVYLAHMQENSVLVENGDMIEEGQQIGSVGNSGNTTEPHLHIHAEKDGVGVPIQFNGEFLTRNSIVKKD